MTTPQTEETVEHDVSYTLPQPPDDWEELFAPLKAEDEDHPIGALRDATVTAIEDDTVALTLADGSEAICDRIDACLPGEDLPRPGDKVPVLVDGQRADGAWRVSIARASLLAIHDRWAERARTGGTVQGVVTQVLRRGFVAEADGLRTFVPGRQSGIPLRDAFDALGRTFTFEVSAFDLERGDPMLSRQRLARAEEAAQAQATLEAIAEDEMRQGTITRLAPFGAFVDLGGVEGLIHVSELGLGHVAHPGDVVSVGDTVDVRVIRVDRERGRIGLSLRDAVEQEQRARIEDLEVGAVVTGTVRRITDFGAFIEVAPGLEGLCHISELSWTERPAHPSAVLDVDAQVQIRVLETRPEEGRISLSLRAVASDPWLSFLDEHPVGTLISGEITRIEPYGLFLQVTGGLEGLCHVSDLTWEGRPDTPADVRPFSIGESLQVRILECDLERRRLRLGLKQVEGDPWDDAADSLAEGNKLSVRITRFDEQAAWAEIVPGLEGRIHISQVSTERIENIRAVLRPGQQVDVICTTADRSRRRIDLSIRAVQEAEERSAPRSHADDDSGPGLLAMALRQRGIESDDAANDPDDAETSRSDATPPGAADTPE